MATVYAYVHLHQRDTLSNALSDAVKREVVLSDDYRVGLKFNDETTKEIAVIGSGVSFSAVTVSDLTASTLLATDGSKNLTSTVSGLSPTFTGMTLSGLTASQAVFTNGAKALVSNAVTGSGSVVMSASPTGTGTWALANGTFSGTLGVTGSAILSTTLVVGHTSSLKSTATEIIGGSGATAGLLLSHQTTNAANKEGRVKALHYTNSEEPITFGFIASASSTTYLELGGGSSVENAVTRIDFFTAANNTTLNGTRRGGFNSSGAFDLVGAATLSSTLGVTGLLTATAGVLAGDNVSITKAGSPAFTLNATSVNNRSLSFQTNGVARWAWVVDNTAESGSNAGSKIFLRAFTDAGATIDSPIDIVRAAGGTMTIARPIAASSTLGVTGLSTLGDHVALSRSAGTSIYHTLSNQSVFMWGGNVGQGANLLLYGPSHATLANDFALRQTSTNVIYYDHSATSLTLDPSGLVDIVVADNLSSAFLVRQGANNYVKVVTSNGAESVTLGNSSTNPSFVWAGSGTATFNGAVTHASTLLQTGVATFTAKARFNSLITFDEETFQIYSEDSGNTQSIEIYGGTPTLTVGGASLKLFGTSNSYNSGGARLFSNIAGEVNIGIGGNTLLNLSQLKTISNYSHRMAGSFALTSEIRKEDAGWSTSSGSPTGINVSDTNRIYFSHDVGEGNAAYINPTNMFDGQVLFIRNHTPRSLYITGLDSSPITAGTKCILLYDSSLAAWTRYS